MPTEVTFGQISDPSQLNQVIDILQRRSGQQEVGKYFLAGSVYANGAIISLYMPTISRNATPASVSTDVADQAPTGGMTGSGVATGNLTANGFQIYSLTTTGPNVNARAGGNWTVQY